jgi:hypothetical protein
MFTTRSIRALTAWLDLSIRLGSPIRRLATLGVSREHPANGYAADRQRKSIGNPASIPVEMSVRPGGRSVIELVEPPGTT